MSPKKISNYEQYKMTKKGQILKRHTILSILVSQNIFWPRSEFFNAYITKISEKLCWFYFAILSFFSIFIQNPSLAKTYFKDKEFEINMYQNSKVTSQNVSVRCKKF